MTVETGVLFPGFAAPPSLMRGCVIVVTRDGGRALGGSDPCPVRQRTVVPRWVVLLTFTGPLGTLVDLATPLRLAYRTAAVGGCSILMHLVIGAALVGLLER